MADNIFSLDIDEKYTKIVDAKKSGDSIEVTSIGKIQTGNLFYTGSLEKNIEDEVGQIKKLVESLKIHKKNVNVVIPDSLTYSQIISMPLLNEKELITAIKYQADQFIPMPIEETNIDIEVISEDQKEKKVLLLIVAAPKKTIERIQTTAEMAGLNPESIENELSSNSRFVNYFNKSIVNLFKIAPEKGIALVNFDSNTTSLSHFSTQELIVKEVHQISLGYNLFLKETQVNTDADVFKAEEILRTYDKKNPSTYPIDKIVQPLISELSRELRLFIGKYNPSTILFTNKIFLFPSLAGSLAEELGIPISILDPSILLKKSQMVETNKHELPIYIPALGGNLR